MAHLIDKDALVAEIERRISQLESKYKELSKLEIWITAKEIEHKINGLKEALSIINTLEVKDVVAEQKGICYGIFNRIIGNNWNLSIPLGKVGLKHGDKVKIFVTKENKL